jgi:hypothetical protein
MHSESYETLTLASYRDQMRKRPSRSQAGPVRTGHGLCASLRRRGPGARELTTSTGSRRSAARRGR